ncbi:hypothetical protein [Ensifer aridi]|uniref:hypothetical protein n=1 Tax=Ensifer aridi TaxID=1708715 RepID=UPI000A0F45B3|nr:hypothetical protein [Ensifer aridi]
MRKLGLFAAAIFTIPASVWAQSMCTEANSPRECYEAGLKMMAEAMGKMEAFKLEYDAKLSDIKQELALPPGTVLAFTVQCPQGWSKLPAGDGNYIRVSDANPMQTGGDAEFTIPQAAVPKLQLYASNTNNAETPMLWGVSGPNAEGKLYSFSSRDAGYSGVASYPFTTLSIGNDSPASLKIEPPFISLAFCQKGG